MSSYVDYNGGLLAGVALREPPELSVACCAGVDIKEDISAARTAARLEIIELKRTSAPWTELFREVERTLGNTFFFLLERTVIIDIANGGRPTIEAIYEMDDDRTDWRPIVLTEDQTGYREDGATQVPRRDIVNALISGYQAGSIEVAATLDLAVSLEEAVSDASLENAKDIDPLALSVALCAWYARNHVDNSFEDVERTPYDPFDFV